jgi:hypothetical protein
MAAPKTEYVDLPIGPISPGYRGRAPLYVNKVSFEYMTGLPHPDDCQMVHEIYRRCFPSAQNDGPRFMQWHHNCNRCGDSLNACTHDNMVTLILRVGAREARLLFDDYNQCIQYCNGFEMDDQNLILTLFHIASIRSHVIFTHCVTEIHSYGRSDTLMDCYRCRYLPMLDTPAQILTEYMLNPKMKKMRGIKSEKN